jgi:hypothetical protein
MGKFIIIGFFLYKILFILINTLIIFTGFICIILVIIYFYYSITVRTGLQVLFLIFTSYCLKFYLFNIQFHFVSVDYLSIIRPFIFQLL